LSRKEGAISSHKPKNNDILPKSPSKATVAVCPTNRPDKEILKFKLKDLLSFLQQHEASNLTLQILLPWDRVPLPSVDITLESSLNAKIEFSWDLSAAVVRFILDSRAGAGARTKVSN